MHSDRCNCRHNLILCNHDAVAPQFSGGGHVLKPLDRKRWRLDLHVENTSCRIAHAVLNFRCEFDQSLMVGLSAKLAACSVDSNCIRRGYRTDGDVSCK